MLLVVWISVISAFLVSNYLLPASASTMLEYKALYAEMVDEPEVTKEQKERLDALLLELNKADNIKKDQLGYLAMNVVFFLVMVPLVLWAARHSGFDDNAVLLSAALMFVPFIFVNFFITGAVLASAFVLGGIAFRKQPASQTGETADS